MGQVLAELLSQTTEIAQILNIPEDVTFGHTDINEAWIEVNAVTAMATPFVPANHLVHRQTFTNCDLLQAVKALAGKADEELVGLKDVHR